MYFKQTDLLEGLSQDFMKEFMNNTVKESHNKGHFLFREGKRAAHFYMLLKGCVKLRVGENGHTVYTVDQPGEAFGWSSLLGRDVYSTSAECKETTKLLKIDVEKLKEILEKDPANGLVFFRHLAGTLGNRLLQTYKMISTSFQTKIPTSFGTGQVLESETTTV
jgi:CRP-like cAMP-binding protein